VAPILALNGATTVHPESPVQASAITTVAEYAAPKVGPLAGELNRGAVQRVPNLFPYLELRNPREQQLTEMQIGVYRNTFPDGIDDFLSEVLAASHSTGDVELRIVHWFALWGGWKSELTVADLSAVAAVGATPMITWEPWSGQALDTAWTLQRAILSGAHDDYVRGWAKTLKDFDAPVMLRFAHEMHNQTYPWAADVNDNSSERYVAAWRHVHAIFEAEGADNVQWVWNPNTMAGAARETYQPIYQRLYPGDGFVDWVGLDIYNGGDALPSWGGWRTFEEAVHEPYAALTTITDKPVVLAEMGSSELGGSKAQWIRDAFATLGDGRFPRIQAAVWFDIDKEAGWSIASSPEAHAAWVDAVAALTRSGVANGAR
jgi:beta-mannanase